MGTGVNREVRLAARPYGFPKDSDFELAETPIPEPGDGQVLVRNVWYVGRPLHARPHERGQVIRGHTSRSAMPHDGWRGRPGDRVPQ